MTSRPADLTGQRFGRLVAVAREIAPNGRLMWRCLCDCGGVAHHMTTALRQGTVIGCGCGARTHGMADSPEYAIFRGIIARCENPHVKCYPHYGGRGVRMAPEWRASFAAFYAELGPRPTPKHSIERIDNDKGYEPGNCRWATSSEQVNNRRVTRRVVYHGEDLPLAEAVRKAGSVIHIEAAWIRIKSGWTTERALETPRLHRSGNARPGVCDDRAKYGLAGPQVAA